MKAERRATPEDSLSLKAYIKIRDAILRGEVPLGGTLSRRKLAADLGMSVLPVSEALQRLETEGLVQSRPRVGTIVKVPTPQDIRGHYVLREALESQSARLFAEKARPEEQAELTEMATRLDKMWAEFHVEAGDSEERLFSFRSLHTRFHLRIAECAGCPALVQAIEKNQILLFNWLYNAILGGHLQPPHWHEELMKDVAGRDPERADAAMRKHVRLGLEQLLERLEPYMKWDEAGLNSFSASQTARAR